MLVDVDTFPVESGDCLFTLGRKYKKMKEPSGVAWRALTKTIFLKLSIITQKTHKRTKHSISETEFMSVTLLYLKERVKHKVKFP